MALEKRSGNYYYYRRNVKESVSFQSIMAKASLLFWLLKWTKSSACEKAEKAELQRKNKEEIEEIDRELSNLEREIKKLTENVLLNLGFYKTRSRERRLRKR